MLRYNVALVVTLLCCTVNISHGWRLSDRKTYELGHAVYNNLDDDIDEYRSSGKQSNKVVHDNELQDKLKKLPANDELFEEDILMDSRLRNAVLGVTKKTVVSLEGIEWPHNTLVYEVEDDFDKAAGELLKTAIHEFETRTCITFKKRTNEKDYIVYSSKKDECSSNIGRIGGRQVIHIGVHCLVLGTVLHETMHALGFIHEHSRADRDTFLDVKWKNIEKDEWSNFNKYTFADVNNEGVEYNFASVMHYRNDAFTNNGKDTLAAKGDKNLKFGQRIKFSVGDVEGINKYYHCKVKLDQPNYNGLFKDYSGDNKDASINQMKRAKLRRFLRNRLFDFRENKRDY